MRCCFSTPPCPTAGSKHELSFHFTFAELLHGETAAELAWGVIFGILLPTALLALSAFLVVKHLTLVVSKGGSIAIERAMNRSARRGRASSHM